MSVKGFADTSLDRLILRGQKLDARIHDAVNDATINRTIDGASTLEVTCDDTSRKLIRSGLFNSASDLMIDDLLFEFVSYRKGGDQLTLIFEAGAVKALKRKKGAMVAKPRTSTRTQFVRRMVREVPRLDFKGEQGTKNLVALARGKRENSWKAITRLADDVQWRAFEDEGTIFFGSDDWLGKLGEPRAISEDDPGIDYIDPEFDGGKRAGRATVTCRITRWASRPGAPIKIDGLGALAGQGLWLIESLSRSLFSETATISLIRKMPDLPEPKPAPVSHDDRGPGGRHGGARGGERGGWVWPAHGTITSPFGPRGSNDYHYGIDIDGETGDGIHAARSGTVKFATVQSGYGNVIYITHDGGLETRYGHLSGFGVRVGQRVSAGDRIGSMGATGNATGSHLHFETRRGGVAFNPMTVLP